MNEHQYSPCLHIMHIYKLCFDVMYGFVFYFLLHFSHLVDSLHLPIFIYLYLLLRTFDLSYALFFLKVTGAPIDDHDLGDMVLFHMNACVCSVLFTCDTEPPLLQKNTFVSVCLWPSSPRFQFVDFNMDIEGNGYSYSPITIENVA